MVPLLKISRKAFVSPIEWTSRKRHVVAPTHGKTTGPRSKSLLLRVKETHQIKEANPRVKASLRTSLMPL